MTRALLFCILLIPFPAFAKGQPENQPAAKLKGYASILWKHPKRTYRFDQVISIQGAKDYGATPTGVFETLDDFGNTVLRIDFFNDQVMLVKGPMGHKAIPVSQFGKILSLPIGKGEFLSYLLNRVPSVPDLDVKRDAGHNLISVKRKSKGGLGRYEVLFSDYRKIGDRPYPFSIVFSSKKTKLRLTWQSLTFSE